MVEKDKVIPPTQQEMDEDLDNFTFETKEGIFSHKDIMRIIDPPPVCDSCNGDGEPSHTCPYGEEISGSSAECNCCIQCQHHCADEI